MEGFLNLRIRPWLRRLVTRSMAVTPALFTIYLFGEKATYELLILSQVVLSLQLPFAIVPLVQFTGDPKRMGSLVSPLWVRLLAWVTAILIIGLNVRLIASELPRFLTSPWLSAVVVLVVVALGLLLLWLAFEPVLPNAFRKFSRRTVPIPAAGTEGWVAPRYRKILVPLDHSDRDTLAISHAAALARACGSTLHLLHIEEGVTSQVYGELASTAEVTSGQQYLSNLVESLRAQGIVADYEIVHSQTPRVEIIRSAKTIAPDLIVMGAHGHKGLKDLILGTTINAVRHELDIPILVVRK